MEDVIIIGAGLAGLATAIDAQKAGRGVTILERYKIAGGRCADWVMDGMRVESGLHRWLGFYTALPRLFRKADLDPNDAVIWEDELEIRLPDGGPRGVLGLSPLHRPLQTAAGLLGNFDLMSPADKAELTLFFSSGLLDYALTRRELDQQTVYEYARKRGVSEDAIANLLIPVTEGIFFLPPERYSAMVLMGLLAPAIKRPHTIRVGSFAGGMTEVMSGPIAAAIERRGGSVQYDTTVERLAVGDGRVRGVYVDGQLIEANHVVLATALGGAQPLIREALGDHPWFEKMLALPTMPAVTLQIELDEPALPEDHVVFSPKTVLASYAEQSRTTFRDAPGRLSIDLGQPEKFIGRPPEEIFAAAMADAQRVGLNIENNVRRYRVVDHPQDFYLLSPGSEALRPPQATPIPGLTLAGDYTRQPLFCSMEGAVLSGEAAAKAVVRAATA
ncbi:MAG: FAD-dependent oxidoreductase [Candidatus Promineofilum sp.]|nr:FAD-dependent oxidoreductase [Promineifilum sp.]MCW5862973.1 FAD-dependent oxidoreductase [Anaerolineae bacterium]